MIEKIKEIWRKWFGKEHEKTTEKVTKSTEKKEKTDHMLQKLEAYLFKLYDFRFNLLTEQTEYAPKGRKLYQQVDQRTLNTLCINARTQGIPCWDKDVNRLLHSQKIKDFHPFLDYMKSLPEWDGTDRVSELALRVSDKPLWINGFHRWMLGMASQWMQLEGQCANAVAPLLVSTEQGRCKSTLFDI